MLKRTKRCNQTMKMKENLKRQVAQGMNLKLGNFGPRVEVIIYADRPDVMDIYQNVETMQRACDALEARTSILDIALDTTTAHWNLDLYRLELRLRVVQSTLAGGCCVHDTANFALKPHLKSENYVSAKH
ncbi:hypothetical protein PsorP6_001306 [Peronosclerospora sorghi]|uniref:Uncharacterized protein n=1 Tax=Peronosclerospora sorghi TaxID=230839 RepID=A0ACC0WRT9_9STRA|nr:hypothetical protein PsorP6_001306 [Peronosclerospora sorghi]